MPVRRSGRGVTLIEAVLFISVAMGVILGGLVFYRQAQTALLTQRTVALYSAILVELRGWHERWGNSLIGQNPWMVDVRPILIASGGVPSSAIDETRTKILTPWGSHTSFMGIGRYVWANTGAVVSDHQIALSMCDVPVAVCTRVTHFDASGKNLIGDGLLGVSIDRDNCGGGADNSDVGEWLVADGAFSPGDAAAACRQAPPPGNRIILLYAHK
jgi:hypothetical protein